MIGEEMMEIAIKFSKGRTSNVMVKYGDDPIKLAKIFVEENGLKEKSVPIIAQYIRNAIDEYETTTSKNDNTKDSTDRLTPEQSPEKESTAILNETENKEGNSISEEEKGQHPNNSSNNNTEDRISQKEYPSSLREEKSDSPPDDSDKHYIQNNDLDEKRPFPSSTSNVMNSTNHVKPRPVSYSGSSSNSNAVIPRPTSGDFSQYKVNLTPENFLDDDILSDDLFYNSEKRLIRRATSRTPSPSLHGNFASIMAPAAADVGLPIDSIKSAPSVAAPEKVDPIAIRTIDHKQYQENIDRDMTLQTFSYQTIAKELVDSATVEEDSNQTRGAGHEDHGMRSSSRPISTRSMGSEVTIPACHSTTTATRPVEESSKTETSGNNSKRWGRQEGTNTFYTSDNDDSSDQASIDIFVRAPRNDSVNVFRNNLNNSSSTKLSISHVDEHQQSNDDHRINVESPTHSFVTEGDLDSNAEQNRLEASRNRDSLSQEPISEEARAELMYNRLKQRYTTDGQYYDYDDHNYQFDHQADDLSDMRSTSTYNPRLDHVPKPTAKTLLLGNKKPLNGQLMAAAMRSRATGGIAAGSKSGPSLVGKSTSERLYITAELNKKKREALQKRKEDMEQKALKEGQFKLSKSSRKLAGSIRSAPSSRSFNRKEDLEKNHICNRLHEDGQVEKKLKDQRSAELKEKITPEEWSCARCGTFQRTSTSAVVILSLHQVKRGAYHANSCTINDEGSENGKSNDPPIAKICRVCQWDQSAAKPFAPVNIGLTLNENQEEILQQGRLRCPPGGASSSASFSSSSSSKNDTARMLRLQKKDIHEYLYAHARQRENLLQLNRVLWEESNQSSFFQPTIPESSQRIVEKYRKSAADREEADAGEDASSSFSEDVTITGNSNRAEYLRRSALERLTTTKLQKDQQAFNLSYGISGDDEDRDNDVSVVSFANSWRLNESREQFVDRLVYEYKQKQARRQKMEEEMLSIDPKTGQKFFHPKIASDESSLFEKQQSSVSRSNDKIIEDILRRDAYLKQKRKQAEDQAIEKMMKEIKTKQVKPLDASKQILAQSMERNITELFQVLLELQSEMADVSPPSLISTLTEEEGQSEARGIANNEKDAAAKERSKDFDDSDKNNNWKEKRLNLAELNTDMMIEELIELLGDVKSEQQRLAQQRKASKSSNTTESGENQNSEESDMTVGFEEFRNLVNICMRRKEGRPGRSYLFRPRKKPAVALQLKQREEQEETFHPVIDKHSQSICSTRRQHRSLNSFALPIEDMLHVEGKRIQQKVETARQESILRESEELTFQPKLYRPPPYVRPKYRGLPSEEEEEEEEQKTEHSKDGTDVYDMMNERLAGDQFSHQNEDQFAEMHENQHETRVDHHEHDENGTYQESRNLPRTASYREGEYGRSAPDLYDYGHDRELENMNLLALASANEHDVDGIRSNNSSPISTVTSQTSINTISTKFTNPHQQPMYDDYHNIQQGQLHPFNPTEEYAMDQQQQRQQQQSERQWNSSGSTKSLPVHMMTGYSNRSVVLRPKISSSRSFTAAGTPGGSGAKGSAGSVISGVSIVNKKQQQQQRSLPLLPHEMMRSVSINSSQSTDHHPQEQQQQSISAVRKSSAGSMAINSIGATSSRNSKTSNR